MIRHFCDRCHMELTEADGQPFIREDADHGIRIALVITNLNDHAIVEICNQCKEQIVTGGAPKIVTLQPSTDQPPVLFQSSEAPKEIPTPTLSPMFEPSLSKEKDSNPPKRKSRVRTA